MTPLSAVDQFLIVSRAPLADLKAFLPNLVFANAAARARVPSSGDGDDPGDALFGPLTAALGNIKWNLTVASQSSLSAMSTSSRNRESAFDTLLAKQADLSVPKANFTEILPALFSDDPSGMSGMSSAQREQLFDLLWPHITSTQGWLGFGFVLLSSSSSALSIRLALCSVARKSLCVPHGIFKQRHEPVSIESWKDLSKKVLSDEVRFSSRVCDATIERPALNAELGEIERALGSKAQEHIYLP